MSLANLILPVEVQSRELDAKLLLACVAAERGVTAILGCHQAIKRSLHALPPAIFVSKGIVKPELFARIERLGHVVVAWDEEALVYMTPETYLRRKVSAEALGAARALFAWGEDNAEIWRGAPGYRGQPILVTGNPRADLLRPELRGYFGAEAESFRERLGPFVLMCSNFGYLRHYLPELSRPIAAAEGEVPEDKIGTLDDPAMLAHRWQMLQAFKYMIPELAKRLPGQRIVVRPHPSEDPRHWLQAMHGLPNVQVIGGGPVVPWLMAADAVLHNGCTTAVEAFLLGRPTIAYEPISHPIYDMKLPNALSRPAADIDAVAEQVAHATEAGFAPSAEQSRLAERFVASWHGDLASERIAQAVLDLAGPFGVGGGRGRRAWTDRASGAWRNIRRVPRQWFGRDEWSTYLRHRFPDLTEADVEARFAKLKAATGRFGTVRVRQRGKNVFQVEAGR